MNVYQVLKEMGKAPEDCIDKEIVTIFKSKEGYYGLGFFERLTTIESSKGSNYKPLYNSALKCEFLELKPEYLLSLFAIIHRKAAEKNIKIKGKEA
ncbi:MAG: hypothetical protein AB7V60_04400 [Candidatus Caldatribacteriota bacterium]